MRGESMKDKSKKSTYSTTFGIDPKKFIEKRSVFYRPLDVDLQFPWETGVEIFGLLPQMVDEAALPSQIDHRRGKSHYPLARVVHKLKYLITSVARRKK